MHYQHKRRKWQVHYRDMDKLTKVIIAVMGAVDIVFDFFTPFAIYIIMSAALQLSSFQQTFLFVIAIIAALFRALKSVFPFIIENGR